MDNPLFHVTTSLTLLATVAVIAVFGLKGFMAWIDLKRAELGSYTTSEPQTDQATGNAGSRIELADLKERLRKLEAIAAGVDL